MGDAFDSNGKTLPDDERLNKTGHFARYVEWGDPDGYFGVIDLLKVGKAQKLIFSVSN